MSMQCGGRKNEVRRVRWRDGLNADWVIAMGYQETAIEGFFAGLPKELETLLHAIFDLLSRFVAYHPASGLTPHHLAATFGPLLFGLSADNQATGYAVGVGTFQETHAVYAKGRAAIEHLLVAWIRAQRAAHDRLTGDFPRTLDTWLFDYPQCLTHPETRQHNIRVIQIRRTVRSYSSGLLASHREWVDDRWATWRALGEPRLTASHRARLGMREKDGEAGAGAGWGEFESLGFGEGLGDRLRFDLGERAKQVRLTTSPIVAEADIMV